MSALNKQPFKLLEIPINKFYNEAIPHHKNLFESHKLTTHKLTTTGKLDQLKKEVKNKHKVVKQLKDLVYELDTLRAQVDNEDLDKFDEKTFSLRKTITLLIKDYNAIEKQALILTETENNINENIENENPFLNCQLQLSKSITEIKLEQEEGRLDHIEAIENDIQDLQGIYVTLNGMVNDQAEQVDQIETNVEETQVNVNSGLKELIKATKLRRATYPITGALLGTLVGGPLGMIAGLKIGGAAALGCGVMGYASGKFFTNCNEAQIAESENALNNSTEIVPTNTEEVAKSSNKKDK